ncbi:F-box domain-containing protein [Meloidogyne graminicola]|uniref:F-box domain-containing protein n=1 Tax=Meloidogyne graminicola TaxID=189291 RepID=A0A8S9ZTQ7_9BILA|nr:F-box domain-containing protein [Meloidogyne graminicola]
MWNIFKDYYLTKPKTGVVYYPLNKQILVKWQSAIDKKIPLFLFCFESFAKKFCSVSILFLNGKKNLKFNLPTYPKNIKELQIIRFWFEQLFRASFKVATSDIKIFNPEMIKLLFEDNNKNINFYVQINCPIYFLNSFYKSQVEFICDHLITTTKLLLSFKYYTDSTEQQEHLLKLFLNCGKRIKSISIVGVEEIQKLIGGQLSMNLKMSVDCSNIVPNFEMEIKAERIEMNEDKKIAICEYTNIYNSSIKYLVKYYYFPLSEHLIEKINLASQPLFQFKKIWQFVSIFQTKISLYKREIFLTN